MLNPPVVAAIAVAEAASAEASRVVVFQGERLVAAAEVVGSLVARPAEAAVEIGAEGVNAADSTQPR